MFRICQNKGFQITFENGWTVSVQFGPGNYCDNSNMPFAEWFADSKKSLFNAPDSKTAEIAAWKGRNGPWYKFEHDTVKGYCTPAEVLAFLNLIAAEPAS